MIGLVRGRVNGARHLPAWLAAFVAAAVAAVLYFKTVLPGLDLGDTASFQTIVTLPVIVPRHAYPLYFALGKLTLALLGGEPSHALNVLSAFAGVVAVAMFAALAWSLTRHATGGLWAALLFAGSYTFWSQALIAEVYTLEAFFISVVLIAALAWWRRPTAGRLAVLYAIYALSFGNHLSMILLAPALTWLLWCGRRRATLDPFSARGIALATVLAAAGAVQYGWNVYGLWTLSLPRPPASELLATFWFDVTKSDWRATLVGTVPLAQWSRRLAMYWWDLRQQFGVGGIAIATIGAVALVRSARTVGVAFTLAYLVTVGFALIYNVGDTHVFLLPSHQIVAAFAACGVALLLRMAAGLRREWRAVCVAALFVIPLWRMWDTWPAVDRSQDQRGDRYANAAVAGLQASSSVYLADLNWQTQNAVGYELTVHQPALPRVFVADVLWHFPEFVARNRELGREIVLTKDAADAVVAVYGTLFPIQPDERERVDSVSRTADVPRGTPYVLVVMTPLPELVYNAREVAAVARTLAGVDIPRARYTVIAGRSGAPPTLNVSAATPYRTQTMLGGHRFDIRIESWLPYDTMRRAGFGHVIVDGRHELTLERGANLGIFDGAGALKASANQGGSFALQPRCVIPVLK